MANQFNVSSYADDRPDADKETGARRPRVMLHRCTLDNPWHPESVLMTPRQARLASAALLKAADAAESGADKFAAKFT